LLDDISKYEGESEFEIVYTVHSVSRSLKRQG
jgi:hypothetical protein